MGRISTLYLLFIIAFTASACNLDHRDQYPMRNPKTGDKVICYSGAYNFDEGLPQIRVAQNCIHACERYGYLLHTGNPAIDTPHPQDPAKGLSTNIPSQCSGEK